MTRGDSNPSQLVRFIWFVLIFFSPMSALAYVSTSGLKDGNRAALIHVLLILSVSLIVSLVCAVAQPVQVGSDAVLTTAARANLALAVFDTIVIALLAISPSQFEQACQLEVQCRTYPVGWLAFAGMHYCYAVWAYTTKLIHSR